MIAFRISTANLFDLVHKQSTYADLAVAYDMIPSPASLGRNARLSVTALENTSSTAVYCKSIFP